MTLTEKLIISAYNRMCPGCGPTLAAGIPYAIPGSEGISVISQYCTCCGWEAILFSAQEASFGQHVPILGEGHAFDCGLVHPEHREKWRAFQAEFVDNPDAEPMDELEKKQVETLQDAYHFALELDEPCYFCGKEATHKIVEDLSADAMRLKNFNLFREPATIYVCCEDFVHVFGPASHMYPVATHHGA